MKILVIDDHVLLLEGLALVLKRAFPTTEICILRSSEQALERLVREPEADLAIVDLAMPGINGVSFIKALEERQLLIPTVVISASEKIADVSEVMKAGARGFIPKTHDVSGMLEGIKRVLEGEVYLPAEIHQRLERFEQSRAIDVATGKSVPISKRQLDVLRLVKDGLSNKQIARVLNISESTTKSHMGALLEATGAKNRTECILRAEALGFL